jgi:hypothetical protein
MAKSPEDAMATMAANLKEKTGKSLEEWGAEVKASGLEKHSELVKLLKERHGLGHGYANLVVHSAKGAIPQTEEETADLVTAQYAGPREGLKPVYDALIAAVQGFGKDIEVSPKKTYVSLRRNKQFALIQPTTKDRVDVGIQLKGVAPAGRLEASGSFNAMVSHRVRVGSVKEVDAELKGWLKRAYEAG